MAKSKKENNVATATTEQREQIMLNPSEIQRTANLGRFRESPTEGRVKKLAESIQEHGQLAPVGVRKTDGGYELVYGWTRVAACELLNREVRAEVLDIAENNKLEKSIAENLRRNEMSPMDKVAAMHRLHNFGKSKREIAQMFNCAAPWVTEAMKINDLPDTIKEAVDEGRCGMRAAVALTKLKDDDERMAVFVGALSTEPDPEDNKRTLEIYDANKIHKEVEKRTGVATAPKAADGEPSAETSDGSPSAESEAGTETTEGAGKLGLTKPRAEELRDVILRAIGSTPGPNITPAFREFLKAEIDMLEGRINAEEFEQAFAKFGGFQTGDLHKD